MLAAFEDSVVTGLRLLAPLFLAVSVGAVAGALSFGGWTFSLEALAPKLDKLDPLAGLKRVFGWSGLTELVKAVAKFVVVALCAGLVLSSMAADFLGLGRLPIQEALPRAAYLCALSFLGFSAVLLVIAACDVPMQWWQYQRRLRMSRQELRDELKETEGKPEVRSRIRSIQQELATRRMMDAVPKADVVATNPTHYAVALRYDARRMRAPRVVAKGADLIALNIRNVARAHGVPLFEHPVLARALYATTDIGKEIPPRLYMAVAQVLTYVYQLRDRRSRRTPRRPAIRIDADVVPGHAPPRAEA